MATNSTLIRLIGYLFGHAEPTGVSDVTLLNTLARSMDELFNLTWVRRQRYNDFVKMDKGYIGSMLDVVAITCTQFDEKPTSDDILEFPRGFKVEMGGTNYGKSGPRQVIAQILHDTKVKYKSYDYIRNMLKYGDAFAEIIYQEDAIIGLQRYLSEQMWVNKDIKGYFMGPDANGIPQAYQQKELREGTIVAGFDPWQIVHWKFHDTDVHAYSEKSILDDLRDDWWKLTFEEQAMVIARLTRAFPRMVHTIDVTGKSRTEATTQLKQYADALTRKQTRSGELVHQAHSPDEDIFRTTGYLNPTSDNPIPKLDKLELFDPRMEGLSNIGDIKYNRSKIFNRIPGDVVGVMDDRQGDITNQDLAYADLLGYSCWRFEIGLRQIFDTGLFLKGYKDVDYRLIFPRMELQANWKAADAQHRVSLAHQTYEETGTLSRREVLRKMGYTDDRVEAILAEVVKEQKEGLPPLGKAASQMGAGFSQK